MPLEGIGAGGNGAESALMPGVAWNSAKKLLNSLFFLFSFAFCRHLQQYHTMKQQKQHTKRSAIPDAYSIYVSVIVNPANSNITSLSSPATSSAPSRKSVETS